MIPTCLLRSSWGGVLSLVVFIILDGLGNGGFFSTVPSVVGHVYGPNRMTGVLGMVLSAWAAGYILVSSAR